MVKVTNEIIPDTISLYYQSIGSLIGIYHNNNNLVTLSLTDNKLRYELLGRTLGQ